MKAPLLPLDEVVRLKELQNYNLLDTLSEQSLDDLAALAAQICEAPIALVSLVDEHRQWFKSKLGLTASETPRDVSFCGHTILQSDLFIVPDATKDDRFADNPLVTGDPQIRFYAGAPLVTPSGSALGALCVMDRTPRQLSETQQDTLRMLARQVMSQFEFRLQSRTLLENETRFRMLTENAPAGLFILDREHRYLYANQAYSAICGQPLSSIIGRHMQEVLPDIYETLIRPGLDRAFSGERVSFLGTRLQSDGSHYYSVSFEPQQTAGAVTIVIAAVTEVTTHKRLELESQHRQAELQLILDAVPALVFFKDRDSRFRRVNRELARLVGLPPESFIGKTDADLGAPDAQRYREDDLQVMTTGNALIHLEEQLHTPDGIRWLLTDKMPLRDESGLITGIVGFSVDITERKLAQQALEESMRQADSTINALSAHLCVLDQAGKILTVNDAWRQFAEANANNALPGQVGDNYLAICDRASGKDAEHGAKFAAGIRAVIRGDQEKFSFEYPCHSPKEQRWFIGRVTRFKGDGPIRVVVAHEQITKRKLAEQANKRLAAIVESSHDAIIGKNLQGIVTSWNKGAEKVFGYASAEIVGNSILRLIPADRQEEERYILDTVGRGESVEHFETLRLRKDGTLIDISVTASPIKDSSGRIIGVSKVARDITARKWAEANLRDSEERFRQLAENINVVFWITDPSKNQMLYVSPAYEKIWGRSCESLYASPQTWLEAIHPEDRERVRVAALARQVSGEYHETYRIIRTDGSLRWVHDQAFPIVGTKGRVHRIVGVAEDISARRNLEEQFRQAQKMEAIGQLAGGVAHDFNNILAAIIIQTELSAMEENLSAELQEGLRDIRKSAERAANLTRQLLLFSRKQVMHATELDLNEAVTSLVKMLKRIIGEHLSLQIHLHPGPLIVHADAGMLDQVLLNLVVNARDAMPDGGRILIETSIKTLTPETSALIPDTIAGDYFCVRVTDTGSGIPPEIAPRIFDPFFTTKAAGKGTGLGLATVFGIIKQHHGSITLESEVDKGTAFKIYLPAVIETVKPSEKPNVSPKPRGGTETILLVEDDESIRALTRIVLERAGYTVLDACDGPQAVELAAKHQTTIRLLLTDMVMPGNLNGRELATQLQAHIPNLRVIITSGYSADMAGRDIALDAGQKFIQKPAPPHVLLEAVRDSLDS
jgi:two-component system, cell cycle sensor histidine kinase and response regulator CckA